ncbi:MAG TPA: o-succinylbenzoate synthase [Acidimicrobiales bacterium]
MRVEAVELRVVALPLLTPFVAAHGEVTVRTAVLVRVLGPDGEGWGECAALPEPTYSAEYTEEARLTLRDHLVPRLLGANGAAGGPGVTSSDVVTLLADVVGHPMAKAALELALLDAEGHAEGRPLAALLAPHPPGPATTVPAGVAIGLLDGPDAVADAVAARMAEGYGRVKLKIAPGRDVAHVRAARQAGGPDLVLVADANGAYRWDGEPGAPDDARRLAELDELGLACLEQPLGADDLLDHVELAHRLATPICLDESLTSPALTEEALDMGACSVVCVKAPRYGSWWAAADVLDRCHGNGVKAWVGGMLDTGIGRLANVALAAHPGATLPGDLSSTAHLFTADVTPFLSVERDSSGSGRLAVPATPGLGATPDPDQLEALTVAVELLRR